MPVVLGEDREDAWLDPDTSEADLKGMLVPYPDKDTYGHPVSKQINYTKNNFPDLIKPVTVPGQGKLDNFFG
jgi:putative SOS response-associated peptidase YedK